jgi:hypothetical protein
MGCYRNYLICFTLLLGDNGNVTFFSGRETDSEQNINIQPEIKSQQMAPTIKTKGLTYFPRGENRPHMSDIFMMICKNLDKMKNEDITS